MTRVRGGLLAFVGLTTLGVGYWALRPAPAPRPAPDPRVDYPSPYRNVRPDVRYVGDAACAGCHADVTERYAGHPMSRSLGPVGEVAAVERYGADARNPFEQGGYLYQVRTRGGRSFHSARRPTGDARHEAAVDYAVGSGTRGRTYLVERDLRLVQSPISWFSGKGIWDLTPGFHADERFERAAQPSCLFCHANRVEPVADTLNAYRLPLFRGHGIGCERCHGPGELHVAARERGDAPGGLDDTIVNPSRLSPPLREAVCEQCHLQGEVRVTRRDRDPFEYRPGLPLELFVSAFVRPSDLADAPTAGGHADQVRQSRCFKGSRGRLGCTSCHDPHAVPAPAERAAHYRARCLACHADRGCSAPEAEREKTRPADSCITCHLPPGESRIVHAAVADHRIPRRPAPRSARSAGRPLQLGEVPLRPFHEGGDPEDPEARRDLGLALSEVGRNYPAIGRKVGPAAVPLLEAAVRRHPDDVAAWETLGFTLWQLNRREEGMKALEAALARVPRRELALTFAAVLSTQLRQGDRAVGYWRRAVEVNPVSAVYRYRLARALADCQEWRLALEECDHALRLDPLHEEAANLREKGHRRR